MRKKYLDFQIGDDVDYFIENLSVLVSSGMTVVDSVRSLHEEFDSKHFKAAIKEILSDMESGASLWSSLEKSNLFDENTVSLIKIGEESGRLAENLNVVSLQEQKKKIFKSRLRSAMIYPIIVIFLAAVIGIGIAWFILPKLAVTFSQLRLDLPYVTEMLINIGIFIDQNGLIFFPSVLILFVFIFYFTFYFHKTRFIGQFIILSIPGIKKLVKEVEISRSTYLLGTLLSSGLPIDKSLSSLERSTTFNKYRKFYKYLFESINDGNSFEKSFKNYKNLKSIIPSSIQQLIITSEKTGRLEESLTKISKSYEAKIETTAKDLSVILEPLLLVFVWVGVVLVALSVILPIYSLVGGIN